MIARIKKNTRCGLVGFGVGVALSILGYATGLGWVWNTGFAVKCLGLYVMTKDL